MLESGLLLFFLVPGLLTYCAVYGVFHSGKSIAPEPPGANSIEAITLILLWSAAVHATTAITIAFNAWLCSSGGCPLTVPAALLDPYQRTFRAVNDGAISGQALGGMLVASLAQGVGAYAFARLYLRHLARIDRLPNWIYGWATDIANAADNDESLIVAYVLTTHEIGEKTVVYGGVLYDLALKPDGCVSRITLWDCERYLADLNGSLTKPTLPEALSRFPFMLIEAANIRNIAFEIVDFADLDQPAPTNLEAQPSPAQV